MIDNELAEMYGVEIKRLNEQVKRNLDRFPDDFMFQLTKEEWEIINNQQFIVSTSKDLRSQNATFNKGRGKYRKYLPYVFPEQGIAMLSTVLNSPTAIQVNISIMRVFVKMRQWAVHYEDLVKKIDEVNLVQGQQNEHIRNIYQIIVELVKPTLTDRKPIGFKKQE
jgi:hypothetical protein